MVKQKMKAHMVAIGYALTASHTPISCSRFSPWKASVMRSASTRTTEPRRLRSLSSSTPTCPLVCSISCLPDDIVSLLATFLSMFVGKDKEEAAKRKHDGGSEGLYHFGSPPQSPHFFSTSGFHFGQELLLFRGEKPRPTSRCDAAMCRNRSTGPPQGSARKDENFARAVESTMRYYLNLATSLLIRRLYLLSCTSASQENSSTSNRLTAQNSQKHHPHQSAESSQHKIG